MAGHIEIPPEPAGFFESRGRGKEIALPGALSRIRIEALDAGDHWRGGLNFIISTGSFRFGALFDRKTWNSVGVAAENLDLAVIEANSIRPMSAKTGHTSLAETLNFLRLLSQAPRLSLLIHMGHDDIEQLSMGSLEALTRGLAPDLAVRWACPGDNRLQHPSSAAQPGGNPRRVDQHGRRCGRQGRGARAGQSARQRPAAHEQR